MEPCKHLTRMLGGDMPGARGACLRCRLVGLKMRDGSLSVTPMVEARPLRNLTELNREKNY